VREQRDRREREHDDVASRLRERFGAPRDDVHAHRRHGGQARDGREDRIDPRLDEEEAGRERRVRAHRRGKSQQAAKGRLARAGERAFLGCHRLVGHAP
jgi:hypothetical protein